jgi:hypothetical protein
MSAARAWPLGAGRDWFPYEGLIERRPHVAWLQWLCGLRVVWLFWGSLTLSATARKATTSDHEGSRLQKVTPRQLLVTHVLARFGDQRANTSGSSTVRFDSAATRTV